MPFSGMIKLKLEFLKSKQDKISKITKKYQFYFTFILEYFLKKKNRLHDTRRRKKEGKRKRERRAIRKKKKEEEKRKDRKDKK